MVSQSHSGRVRQYNNQSIGEEVCMNFAVSGPGMVGLIDPLTGGSVDDSYGRRTVY
jgi:hypothetical protein